MSQISSTPRRPSTAQSAPLTARMPYEAGEALLWERQNHRVHAHLSIQIKELQAQHDAYDARIQATESIAEAAEAAFHKVKQMEAKIAAMEADDQDRPFDAWAKEAISQFQVFVDSHKGVRQKLSGLEQKVGNLSEDMEGVGDAAGLLRNVVRRLEVLENEKKGEGEKLKAMEKEMERLRSTRGRQALVGDKVEPDDNPLHVFYGIDTEPHREGQDHSPRRSGRFDEDRRLSILSQSPEQHSPHRGNDTFPGHGDLQPPDEDILRPAEQSFVMQEAAPEIEYDWENTQQFKDMQEELAALRAMCRTQEPKSSGQTADTTQRPQDTIVLPRERIPDFSDATTETEAEYNNADRQRVCVGVPSSDIHMPSSPPRRHDTQSARRNLMKRPSIHDPRVSSINEHSEHRQPGQPAPDPQPIPDHRARPSLLVKLPAETQIIDDRVSAKRKRIEDAPVQRATRPKLTDSRATVRKPTVPVVRKFASAERSTFLEPAPLAFSDEAHIPVSPTRKTYSKQKPAVNPQPHQAVPRTSPNQSKQPVVPVAKPTVSVAEVKSWKAVSKTKPVASAATQQQQPPEAGPSNSKQAPVTVKREAKSARQPPGACKSCRLRHQKCDRIQPTCQRCAKLGISCEYRQASGATVPPSAPSASSPRKKQALLPIPAAEKDANCNHGLRERSVTVSPEAPRHKSPAKRQMPTSPSKKSVTTAAPTAASARAPRAKKAPNPKASPTKQK